MKAEDLVFLSASVPYRPGWVEDSRPAEIEEAVISIARAVFARKGRLLFGGHPSISPLVSAVAGEYYPADPQRRYRPVITFQSEYYRGQLPDDTWELHRMGWSAIEWTPAIQNANGEDDKELSLRQMREWMLLGPNTPKEILARNEMSPPIAMFAVGGMEGVRDEAAMFLRHSQQWGVPKRPPVVLVTSGGGAAARVMQPDKNLWLPGQTVDSKDLSALQAAWETKQMIPLEQTWRAQLAAGLPDQGPFEPYAAMTQWLLDRL